MLIQCYVSGNSCDRQGWVKRFITSDFCRRTTSKSTRKRWYVWCRQANWRHRPWSSSTGLLRWRDIHNYVETLKRLKRKRQPRRSAASNCISVLNFLTAAKRRSYPIYGSLSGLTPAVATGAGVVERSHERPV